MQYLPSIGLIAEWAVHALVTNKRTNLSIVTITRARLISMLVGLIIKEDAKVSSAQGKATSMFTWMEIVHNTARRAFKFLPQARIVRVHQH